MGRRDPANCMSNDMGKWDAAMLDSTFALNMVRRSLSTLESDIAVAHCSEQHKAIFERLELLQMILSLRGKENQAVKQVQLQLQRSHRQLFPSPRSSSCGQDGDKPPQIPPLPLPHPEPVQHGSSFLVKRRDESDQIPLAEASQVRRQYGCTFTPRNERATVVVPVEQGPFSADASEPISLADPIESFPKAEGELHIKCRVRSASGSLIVDDRLTQGTQPIDMLPISARNKSASGSLIGAVADDASKQADLTPAPLNWFMPWATPKSTAQSPAGHIP